MTSQTREVELALTFIHYCFNATGYERKEDLKTVVNAKNPRCYFVETAKYDAKTIIVVLNSTSAAYRAAGEFKTKYNLESLILPTNHSSPVKISFSTTDLNEAREASVAFKGEETKQLIQNPNGNGASINDPNSSLAIIDQGKETDEILPVEKNQGEVAEEIITNTEKAVSDTLDLFTIGNIKDFFKEKEISVKYTRSYTQEVYRNETENLQGFTFENKEIASKAIKVFQTQYPHVRCSIKQNCIYIPHKFFLLKEKAGKKEKEVVEKSPDETIKNVPQPEENALTPQQLIQKAVEMLAKEKVDAAIGNMEIKNHVISKKFTRIEIPSSAINKEVHFEGGNLIIPITFAILHMKG